MGRSGFTRPGRMRLMPALTKDMPAGTVKLKPHWISGLLNLSDQLKVAHREWQDLQKMLDAGILDLAFDLAESVLEIPVENPDIRETMQRELSRFFGELTNQPAGALGVGVRRRFCSSAQRRTTLPEPPFRCGSIKHLIRANLSWKRPAKHRSSIQNIAARP